MESTAKPGLCEQVRTMMRFHQQRDPQELGVVEVNAFLTWLASIFRQGYRP